MKNPIHPSVPSPLNSSSPRGGRVGAVLLPLILSKNNKIMKHQLKTIKALIAYAYAKFKADRLNALTGRRYFILMADSGKLVVTDKSQFYKLRRRGSMPKAITPRMLPRISVYYTAGMYKGRLSPCMADKSALMKKRRYLNYVRNLR